MLGFLKENLLWILIPMLLVILGVAALLYFTGRDQGADSGFVYPVF